MRNIKENYLFRICFPSIWTNPSFCNNITVRDNILPFRIFKILNLKISLNLKFLTRVQLWTLPWEISIDMEMLRKITFSGILHAKARVSKVFGVMAKWSCELWSSIWVYICFRVLVYKKKGVVLFSDTFITRRSKNKT